MEQAEAFISNTHHEHVEQGLNGEGPDMESLEDDFKSLLIVPSSSKYSDVELLSDEVEMHSDGEVSSFEEQGWCKITRNSDICSETLQNKSLNVTLFDETDVLTEDTTLIKCGREMVPLPVSEVYPSKRFKVLSMNESSKLLFKEIHQGDSFVKRSDEEFAVVNSYLLKEPLSVVNYGKKPKSKTKRVRSMPVADIYETCDQCETEYGGFQCSQNTMHLQCHACGVTMPSRDDICVPQHCIGCDRAFCGAYWHSQQVTRSEVPYICAPENFKPIGERTITTIPLLAHERNRHEQDITERCIQRMGTTLQDVVSSWVTKLNNREIVRTRMPLNHPEMITSETHVCNGCYDKLVSFLLYWFRIPKSLHHIPAEAGRREDCWYGYTCRTQHHNDDHARKRNHVCAPTKGSIGN